MRLKDGVDIHAILRKYWGYGSFRPMQEEIIRSVLDGNDTLGLLPTGGGKSVTFQVPALAIEGLTLVVTPLISLMKDQVDNLRDRGVSAMFLHSGLTLRETRLALDKCRLGKARMLYLSPEKLQSRSFASKLRDLPVSLIVVDEAHCISQWGYDFRPSYLCITDVREMFPDAPVLALTASATPEVVDDIKEKLSFRNGGEVFRLSFTRDNISFVVRYDDYKERQLLNVVKKVSGCSIVYVRSRRRTREIAEFLMNNGVTADFYHAGLAPEDKNEKQNRWKRDEVRVIVATNAFGMGIDKPDVRLVVHYDLPSSLEEYYQEAGRAGRDGKPAYAVVVAAKTDKGLLSRRVSDAFPDKDFIRNVYGKLCVFLNLAMGEGYGQLAEFDFADFCSRFSLPVIAADSALKLLTQAGYIEYIDDLSARSRIMMTVTRHELYDVDLDPQTERVLQAVLRTYTGIFSDYEHIDEQSLGHRLELTPRSVYDSLLKLGRMHIIHYVPRKAIPYIYMSRSREPDSDVLLPKNVYEFRKERMAHRVEAMKRFVFDSADCRVNTMLEYFGEHPKGECGSCDVCRSKKHAALPTSAAVEDAGRTVAYLCSQSPLGRSIDYLLSVSGLPQEVVVAALRGLLDRGDIVRLDSGKFCAANAEK